MYVMSRARSGIVSRCLRVLLPILIGTMLGACASGGGGAHTEESDRPSALMVQNRSWMPVTVYVSKSGVMRRIGAVEATSGRVFVLDELPFTPDGRDQYLVARPLSGDAVRSEAFAFSPGRTTIWTIEKAGSMSRVVVR
jgi:hypothetical protein